MKSVINRLTGDRGRKDAFRDWPPPVWVQSIPVEAPRTFQALRTAAAEQRAPQKYGDAIVIGLGSAGEQVLQEWLDLISQDPAGPQENLRALLITSSKAAPLRSEGLKVRQFDLLSGGLAQVSVGPWRSQRERLYRLFRQDANYRPFEEYLHGCLTELKEGVQVVVVGSAAENEIGLLGPVLQAVRLAGEARFGLPPSGVTAMLTLSAPVQTLMDGEIYAALREVGRFTFAGTQWIDAPSGVSSGAVHSALLDHVLLLEAQGSPPYAPNLADLPFKEGVGQVAGEALFVLLHPIGRTVLEDLKKTPSAEIRAKAHYAVAHGLGIATLHVPLQDLGWYSAARLARAVIYSEGDVRAREGLAYRPPGGYVDHAEAESQAHSWLSRGPGAHPFFEWLFSAQDARHFRVIPNVSPEFKIGFKAQIAAGLVQLLNDPLLIDRLGLAHQGLRWLEQRFTNLLEWFHQASAQSAAVPERRWLQDFLDEALKTIRHFVSEIRAWETVLYSKKDAGFAFGFAAQFPSLRQSWWNTPADETGQSATGEIAGNNLAEIFEHCQRQAEERLHKSGAGRVRCSILDSEQEDLREARLYYERTIRPELGRGAQELGRAFERVRERLGWWVRLEEAPKVLLVCVPAPNSRSDEQAPLPAAALWEPAQFAELAGQILELCRIQAQGLTDDLVGPWLRERFLRSAAFLRKANYPLIDYEQPADPVNYYRTTRRAYLLGRDKTLTGDCKTSAFPGISASEVQELDGGEPNRLTALTVETNIPLGALLQLKKYYSSYSHLESYHIYLQEQIATRYERRIRSFAGWQELPPDLTMLLADDQRITIFCQAVFCELIQAAPDEMGYHWYWSVLPLDEQGKAFPLAPADGPGSLLDALRAFVLDLPNEPGLAGQFGSPFHYTRYSDFIHGLWKEARRRRVQPEFALQRQRFEREHLAYWIQQGERDRLARGFAHLLQTELEEPVWNGW